MKKSYWMMPLLVLCLSLLAGCKASNLQEAAQQISELEQNMQNAKNDMDSPQEETEEADPEPVYVTYHQSQRGYDVNGHNYAVKQDDESGTSVFSIVTLDELKERSEPVTFKSYLYREMKKQYLGSIANLYQGKDLQSGNRPLNIDELKEAIMIEADLLLCLEYYSDSSDFEQVKDEASRIAYLIYESVDTNSNELELKYNSVAILEKIIYILPELTCCKEANEIANTLWSEAEKADDDSKAVDINRAWAASELYRVSGQKTYRTIVESVKEENDFNGFSYDNPGYYCAFAYLSTFEKTNYSVCEAIMNSFVNKANVMIKTEFNQFFIEALNDENKSNGKYNGEYINEIITECMIATMANNISTSVEYTGYVQDRLHFLCGANPTGIDYLSTDNQYDYNPALFVMMGMNK